MMEHILNFLNSPLGVTAIASLVVVTLNFIYGKKPLWAKYEGAIISAIKFAEKAIPDDAENKSLSRLDHAFQYVLKVYREANGKEATAKKAIELKEGIQLIHDKLERNGNL